MRRTKRAMRALVDTGRTATNAEEAAPAFPMTAQEARDLALIQRDQAEISRRSEGIVQAFRRRAGLAREERLLIDLEACEWRVEPDMDRLPPSNGEDAQKEPPAEPSP